MSLLHPETCECVKSELELFTIPPTQTSIEGTRFEKYYPLTSLDRGGPLEFKIHSGDKEYIDPENVFLYLQMQILDGSGEVLSDAEDAADDTPDDSVVLPINNFHASCFKSIEVHLNGKPISGNDSLYPYRPYLETLLSYSKSSKEEHLTASMFFKDLKPLDAFEEEDFKTNNGANCRWLHTQFSKTFETVGRLHSEIFSQGRLLLNKVEMNIKLQRADYNLALMATNSNARYSININKAMLYVAHKKISDSVREAHELALLNKNAMYPVRKVQMKFFTRGAHRSDLSEPNLINGILPRRIVFGLVDSNAFNGSLNHNPFNFQHFDVNHIVLRKNGQAIPFEGMDMNYDDNLYLQGYITLLQGTGRLFKNLDSGLNPHTDFANGYALYAFDLTPDSGDSGAFNLIQEGNISLDIKLKKGHKEGITIVCYLEYDAIVEIDKDRNVHYE